MRQRWSTKLKRYLKILIPITISFVLGWFVGPGLEATVLRTVRPISLTDQNGVRLGTLPVGTRVMASFWRAPDVGLEGCVPISLGDSLPAANLFEVSERLYTGLFVYSNPQQKIWIRGVAP